MISEKHSLKPTDLQMAIMLIAIFASFVIDWFLAVLIFFGVLFWIIKWRASGRFMTRTPIDLAVLLMIFTLPLTVWATDIPERTFLQVARLVGGIFFFYTIARWGQTRIHLKWLISGVVMTGVIFSIIAPFVVEWRDQGRFFIIPSSFYENIPLLVSDFVHRNVMGGILAIVFSFSLGFLVFAWRELSSTYRLGLLVAVGLMGSMLFLLQSRGAVLGVGAAITIFILLRWKRGWIVVGLLLLSGAILLNNLGADRLLEILSTQVSIEGADGRISMWARAIEMIQDFPITGVGMGTYGETADSLYPFSAVTLNIIPHAHNIILQIGVDLGIPGIIGWLAVFIVIIGLSWDIFIKGRRLGDLWISGLGAAGLGSGAALIVHGMIDSVTWGMVRPAPLVWGLWGLITASWVFIRQPRLET